MKKYELCKCKECGSYDISWKTFITTSKVFVSCNCCHNSTKVYQSIQSAVSEWNSMNEN